jgi:hypothetical protein
VLFRSAFSLALFPVTKSSIWIAIAGVPFERALKVHRWLGRLAALFAAIHFATMYGVEPLTEGFVLYGTISACCFFAVALLSMEPIRRGFYNLFRMSHLTAVLVRALAPLCKDAYSQTLLFLTDRLARDPRMCAADGSYARFVRSALPIVKSGKALRGGCVQASRWPAGDLVRPDTACFGCCWRAGSGPGEERRRCRRRRFRRRRRQALPRPRRAQRAHNNNNNSSERSLTLL